MGKNGKARDLEVDSVRAIAINNVRTQVKDEKMCLTPARAQKVENSSSAWTRTRVINVTLGSVRLRKLETDADIKEHAARARKKQMKAPKQQNNNPKGRKKK